MSRVEGMKKQIVGLLAIYGLCLALTSILWSYPIILSGCLLVISVLVLHRWHSKADVLFYSIAFLLGPLGEAIVVRSGAYVYAKPSFLIPLWLPLLWGIVALFFKKLCESLAGK